MAEVIPGASTDSIGTGGRLENSQMAETLEQIIEIS